MTCATTPADSVPTVELARRDTARYMAALAIGLSFAPSLMRRDRREQIAISLGAAGLGAAAGWATETLVVQVARRVEGGETSARLTIAAVGAGAALARLDQRSRPLALVGTAARVAGIAAMVGWAAPERRRVAGFDPLPLAAAGSLAAAVMAVRAERKRRRRKKLDFPHERYLRTVSWGDESLVPRESLDFEGQRFLAATVDSAEMPFGGACDPIRVFVGLRSAANVAERADLAMAELERLGAFERGRILVCSATLRGYVNPIPVAAAEHFARGDIASVCVQYYDRRTPFLWRQVPIAAQTHRELVARLSARLQGTQERGRTPFFHGPELVVYGESLGAWASQRAFESLAHLDRLGVRRALWVGTPYFSRLGRALRQAADPRVGFLRTRDVRESDPEGAERLRFVFLERLTDPVVLFPGIELLWRRPPWQTVWRPGISFLHGVVDLVKAARWTADEPASVGHDYRIELPLTVNVALGHLWPREQASEVARTVLETEAARLARVREARKAASMPEPVDAAGAQTATPGTAAPTPPR